MLSGPSFRSAFVFGINSLILSGFPSTSFHLADASLSPFSWLYTLVCAVALKVLEKLPPNPNLTQTLTITGGNFTRGQFSGHLFKNMTKCFLFIIIHIFSTDFAINLFAINLKT